MDLKQYQKQKEYLICVDSDGCAMDTMDIKHIRCFGPCMVEEWGLSEWRDPILQRWNEINLYTMTRGINRFKGLAMALKEIDAQYCKIPELSALTQWVDESDELSEPALEQAIAKQDCVSLRKALAWSKEVNRQIDALPFEVKKPFPGVKEALAFAHQKVDIAIVSSANLKAVVEEWEGYGLLEHVDILLAQDSGSKAYCIQELLKKGYEKDHVMMAGDAPGDYEAAKKNGVFYYPILVRKEKESWKEFQEEAVNRLVEGRFTKDYQEKKVCEFKENLN